MFILEIKENIKELRERLYLQVYVVYFKEFLREFQKQGRVRILGMLFCEGLLMLFVFVFRLVWLG